MSDRGRCAGCGRVVALRGRTGEGRICSNCCAIRNTAVCETCGETRRVAGRDGEGRAWCERCRKRHRRDIAAAERGQLIVDAVTAADSSLSNELVRAVLGATVPTRRSLFRLASHIAVHPDVFSVGPTTGVWVLDRFTEALVAAGAQTVRSIHPICDGCGRRRRFHARTARGAVCAACWARDHKLPCSVCERVRRVDGRDHRGGAVCTACSTQRRRAERFDDLVDDATTVVCAVDQLVTRSQIAAAVKRAAPTGPARELLVHELGHGPSPAAAARRHPLVARLFAALRTDEAAIAAATCGDCDQPAEPFVIHGGVVRCRSCERLRFSEYRRGSEGAARQLIAEAVIAGDPSLSNQLIVEVLDHAVGAGRSLQVLASHIASHPDVFTVGPTSTMMVLDRFTQALVTAGAQRVRTIDPICSGCGRRRPRYGHGGSGGLCETCWARNRKVVCIQCGQFRRFGHRDPGGGAICAGCLKRNRRNQHVDETVNQVLVVLGEAAPSLARQAVVAAVEHAAPTRAARTLLVAQLRAGPSPALPARRHFLVARLFADLRAGGAAIPAAICHDCNGPAEPLAVRLQVLRCQACFTHCPACGHARVRPQPGRCGWCNPRPPKPACPECGRTVRGLVAGDRCRQCQYRGRRCVGCGQTAKLIPHNEDWICHRCALGGDVDDLLGEAGRPPGPLAGLRAAIVGADNPRGVRRWLRTASAGRLLGRLASGEVPLTHDALDAAGDDHSIAGLRALLVATAALPAEDRSIERLQQYFDRYIDTHVADGADRKVVRAWLRWHTLPRLRKRAASGASMEHSANNAQRSLRIVAEFVAGIDRQGRNLRSATQADIDDWFAASGAEAWLARPFMAWARTRTHLSRQLCLPVTPPRVSRPNLDDPERWAIGRRLIGDGTLAVDDRVAAALVVLYGQPLTRVARLTTTDIHPGPDGTVIVDLDHNPVPLHQPFATLIAALPLRRTHGVTDQISSAWLFPGGHAGHHVRAGILAERLRAIGIEVRNMRNTARAQLATEIPPALLGKLIGVSPATATRWATITSSNWTAYAADRAQ